VVDRVQEVARIPQNLLERPPRMLETEIDLAFISHIAKLNEKRMILVLDIDRILSPQEKAALLEVEEEAPEGEAVSEEALFQIAE